MPPCCLPSTLVSRAYSRAPTAFPGGVRAGELSSSDAPTCGLLELVGRDVISAGALAVAMYRVPHSSQRKGSHPNIARGRSNHRRRERWASGLRQHGHCLPNEAEDFCIVASQMQKAFSRGPRAQARKPAMLWVILVLLWPNGLATSIVG